MEYKNLLEIKNKGLIPEYFPTPMQAFIFHNWGMIAKERLAEVLETTVENVVAEANRMGLEEQGDVSNWLKKGYITIIRSNWHILPYYQLLTLLGWNEEKLNLALKEEDFLEIKLGKFKPECEKVLYCKLTDEEKKETEKISNSVKKVQANHSDTREPFDFWSGEDKPTYIASPEIGQVVIDDSWTVYDKTNDYTAGIMADRFVKHMKSMWNIDLSGKTSDNNIELSLLPGKPDEYHNIIIEDKKIKIEAGSYLGILRALYRLEDIARINGGTFFDKGVFERVPRFDARYIYSFSALYEGALDVDSKSWCPDGLLEKYAQMGVNGIWLQGILYRLTEFPFDPSISKGWDLRQKNLRNFIDRAKTYGIKIYIYLNEPRSMPHSFFEKYPHLKGSETDRYATMCTMQKETQEYLSGAVEKLCRAVPGIGGFFTITMSENPTHCRSKNYENLCPVCGNIHQTELIAKVNTLIAEGVARVDKNIHVIAWDWAWTPPYNISIEDGTTENCIQKTPENVAILCQRDLFQPFTRGGISDVVDDYSISVDGISETTRKTWELAKKLGHKTAVKLQINNSWECSTTPYLPVYNTIIKHFNSLIETDVNHLMLSWTLGGYPSPNIKLASESFFIENGNEVPDYDRALNVLYGKDADVVKKATDIFCEAFAEFPFHIGLLYRGPQNGGVANPFYHKPTGYDATMTCFAYDDLEKWRAVYPVDILESQFKKVSDTWEKGLELLENVGGEIADISYVSYSLFKSSYNQIRFIRLRDKLAESDSKETRREILDVIRNEKRIAEKVYEIMRRRPEVGFEAANHYYFNADNVLEKVINCQWLEEAFTISDSKI